MDHRRLRFPDPEPRKRAGLPAVLRDPLRVNLLVGLLLLVIGALVPWIRAWTPGRGFFDVSGFEGAGDAGLVLELGAIAFVLTWSDRAWDSRTTILVAGPAILGAACVLVLRIAYGEAETLLRSLEPTGGYGSVQPGFWVTVGGAVVATVAAAIHLWRGRARLSFNIGLTAPAIAGTIGGVAGAVAGFFAGVRIAELFTAGAIAGVSTSVLVLLSFTLAFLGAWVGAVGAAGLARTSRRR
jgi:hypothetical protein